MLVSHNQKTVASNYNHPRVSLGSKLCDKSNLQQKLNVDENNKPVDLIEELFAEGTNSQAYSQPVTWSVIGQTVYIYIYIYEHKHNNKTFATEL